MRLRRTVIALAIVALGGGLGLVFAPNEASAVGCGFLTCRMGYCEDAGANAVNCTGERPCEETGCLQM